MLFRLGSAGISLLLTLQVCWISVIIMLNVCFDLHVGQESGKLGVSVSCQVVNDLGSL